MKYIRERKQVGIIYHYTSLVSLLKILKTGTLKAGAEGTISTTRNKNGKDMIFGLESNQCCLVLDGNTLSDTYKIKPYRDIINSYEDEQEERIFTSEIKNIDKYIIKIILFNPDDWSFSGKETKVISKILGLDYFDLDAVIEFLENNFSLEIKYGY